MMEHDIGLRPEDLTRAERDALVGLLDDPAVRRQHEEALVLAETLASLPDAPGGPSAAEVLARARAPSAAPSPSRAPWVGVGLAIAAAAALVVGLQPDAQRARGVATPDAEVRLEAVSDGPTVRALASGAELSAGDAVVFYVHSAHAGSLTLTEVGPAGRTEIARWDGPAGRHPLGGAEPLAWTPDDSTPGLRRYVVQWCEPGGGSCVEDTLPPHWR